MRFLPPALALLFSSALAPAADPRGDHPESRPSTPEEEQALFHLPPGFEIQLVAAEPEIQKPINLNFDAQGRLWVTGSELYPWPAATDAAGDPLPEFAKVYRDIESAYAKGGQAPEAAPEGRDTVRVLSDFDEKGRARKTEVFADKLNIPGGVQPLPRAPGAKGDTAIVYSIPYIWRLEDSTGSGHADKREKLYGPFGYLDTHGGSASYIHWIDGWIYGTHGFRNHSEIHWKGGATTVDSGNTYRFKADGSAFEYYTHGQTNPFGLTFDPAGNLYSADSHSRPVYLLVRGGYYEGIGKQDDGLGLAPRITDDDHGSSAIAGLAYYADDKWPEEYRGNLFNGNPVTRRVNRDRLEWTGSTPRAIRQPDFIVSDDPWFRPVQVKLGPDGALYIADFYNAIIGHYEVALTDPHRDRTHGRIWRVIYNGATAVPPKLSELPVVELTARLGDANLETRRLATNELVRRGGPEVIAAVRPLAGLSGRGNEPPPGSPLQRAHARWVLGRVAEIPPEAYAQALTTETDPFLLQHLIRLAHGRARGWTFDAGLRSASPEVRRAALESIEDVQPHLPNLREELRVWKEAPAADAELIYAARVAARNELRADLTLGDPEALRRQFPAEDQGRVAELALGITGAAAADFLFGYLRETGFEPPRAGDFLKQVVLGLEPAERLRELPLERFASLPLAQRLALAAGLSDGAHQRGVSLSPEQAHWTETTLVEALGDADEKLADRAIAALRNRKTEAKLPPLRKLALDPAVAEKRRLSALEAGFDCAGGPALAAEALADAGSLPLRKRAADLLGQRAGAGESGAEARATLERALATAPWELAATIGAALAKTDLGAETLLATIEAGHAPAALLRHNAVSGPLSGRAGELRDRAKKLTKDLPPEDARLDRLIAQRAAAYRAALAESGEARPSAARGALVFQQNCAPCHKVKNTGGNIGPNLDGVSARGVDRLLEDILDPNRNVDPAFRQTIVETGDGQTLAGVQPREAGELLILSDAQGKEVSVPKTQVKSQTASLVSLMPAAFEQVLAAKDLNDLAAFLLGSPEAP